MSRDLKASGILIHSCLYGFICGLVNDAVSSSGCIGSDDMMINNEL
jgi:hypothetical protein